MWRRGRANGLNDAAEKPLDEEEIALRAVRDPAAFAPLYEQLLAAGGSKTYVEALAPFGLAPRDKAFWAAGCARLERLIDEFEQLG